MILSTIIGLNRPMIVLADQAVVNAQDLQGKEITAKNTETRLVHVRSLAASCAACHGTNGNSAGTDRGGNAINLSGMDSKDFIMQMLTFKSGERPATVMQHHAKGLNSEEITDLAEYFSAQIIKIPVRLNSQKLSAQSTN